MNEWLKQFIELGGRISDYWEPRLDENYPVDLPSFDELMVKLAEWARSHYQG